MDCHCIGVLAHQGGKVILKTEEVLSSRSINTQKQDLEKKTYKKKVQDGLTLSSHGFSTDAQKYSYLGLSSIFWVTIILISRTAQKILKFNIFSSEFPVTGKIARSDDFSDFDMPPKLQKMR